MQAVRPMQAADASKPGQPMMFTPSIQGLISGAQPSMVDQKNMLAANDPRLRPPSMANFGAQGKSRVEQDIENWKR